MSEGDIELTWQWRGFDDLSVTELYALLKLRQDVFVLEQDCLYPDIDGEDRWHWHLLAWHGAELSAYLRVIPPQHHHSGHVAIGRVVTSKSSRGQGIGQALMQHALIFCADHFPGEAIQLSAQQPLQKFYQELGFAPVSEVYLEDGIPHLEMLRPATAGLEDTCGY